MLDTALMLMSRDSIGTITADLGRAVTSSGDLATGDHTVMGRTLMQSALPLPLSTKVDGWRRGLADASSRLGDVAAGLPVQLGGPVGDGSTLGEHYEDVRARSCRRAGPGRRAELAHDAPADGRSRSGARHGVGSRRQDRPRRGADGPDRGRRGARGVQRPRRIVEHAAQVQPDRGDLGARVGATCSASRGPPLRPDGAGARTRGRRVARGVVGARSTCSERPGPRPGGSRSRSTSLEIDPEAMERHQ